MPRVGYLILEAVTVAGFPEHYSRAHNFISDLGVTARGMSESHEMDSPLAYLTTTALLWPRVTTAAVIRTG